jgi:hypothetical protein
VNTRLLGNPGHALPVRRTHPPSDISLDRLAVTTHCSAPSSPRVCDWEGCHPFLSAGDRSSFCAIVSLPITIHHKMDSDQLQHEASRFNVYILKNTSSGFCLDEMGGICSVYWCEGISHSVHVWKSAPANSLFVCTLPWHHTEDLFLRARLFMEEVNPVLAPENFVILCNAKDEVDASRKAGWPNATLCSHNAWLDESLYCLNEKKESDRPYDLVINLRPEKWKRPHIAAGIDRLAIIKGNNYRKNEYYELSELNPAYINVSRLGLSEVVDILNSSKVGGSFSAVEGGCYSSSEYLLCGLPVISTESLGGRDVYYTDINSRIIEPCEISCRAALGDLINSLERELELRKQIRADHINLSSRFRNNAYTLIDQALFGFNVRKSARSIIEREYRNKMTRYSEITA